MKKLDKEKIKNYKLLNGKLSDKKAVFETMSWNEKESEYGIDLHNKIKEISLKIKEIEDDLGQEVIDKIIKKRSLSLKIKYTFFVIIIITIFPLIFIKLLIDLMFYLWYLPLMFFGKNYITLYASMLSNIGIWRTK